MAEEDVKVAIIGAGTAGLCACAEVSKVTDKFVLINHGPLGTSCVRAGCMPTKTLASVTDLYHQRHRMERCGIKGSESLTLDIPDVLRHVRDLRAHFLHHTLEQTDHYSNHFIQGKAEFLTPNMLSVAGRIIRTEATIIATGSSPIIPKEWQDFSDYILTPENIFEQQSLPETIAVIGLGMLGIEMTQLFTRMGIETIAISRHDMLGNLTDHLVSHYAFRHFSNELVMITGFNAVPSLTEGGIRITAGEHFIDVEKVFMAVGRKPNLTGLGLEHIGILSGPSGVPEFNPHTMQIKDYPIFIAGDADRDRNSLNEASDEGKIAGYNATHSITPFKRRVPMKITHTDPGIAVVGTPWSALTHAAIAVGEVQLDNQGSLVLEGEGAGIIRIYGDIWSGRIKGAELYAPEVSHLGHLLAWIIETKLSVFEAISLPFYHPAIEEALHTAFQRLAEKVHSTRKNTKLELAEMPI